MRPAGWPTLRALGWAGLGWAMGRSRACPGRVGSGRAGSGAGKAQAGRAHLTGSQHDRPARRVRRRACLARRRLPLRHWRLEPLRSGQALGGRRAIALLAIERPGTAHLRGPALCPPGCGLAETVRESERSEPADTLLGLPEARGTGTGTGASARPGHTGPWASAMDQWTEAASSWLR